MRLRPDSNTIRVQWGSDVATSARVKPIREYAEEAHEEEAKAASATARDAQITIARQWDKLADDIEAHGKTSG